MEFKDLPISIQEMAADVIRSQLARNPMILVDKLFIRNLSIMSAIPLPDCIHIRSQTIMCRK